MTESNDRTAEAFLASPEAIQEYIENAHHDRFSGELRFTIAEQSSARTTSAPTGHAKLYLERGAIAWGFASGQRVSFQSILLSEHGFDKEQLVHGIHEARSMGKRRLDEMLLALGVSDTAAREDIVVRHTRAALDVLESWPSCGVEVVPTEILNRGKSLKDLPSTLKPILTRIPGCFVLSIVDLRSGTPLGTATREGDFASELASAFFSDLLRSAADTLISLGRGSEEVFPIEELILSGKTEYTVLLPLRGGSACIVAMLDKHGGIAQARATLQRSAAVIMKFL